MVVNFRVHGISQDAPKLTRTLILITKKLFSNPDGYSSTGQVLNLFSRDY